MYLIVLKVNDVAVPIGDNYSPHALGLEVGSDGPNQHPASVDLGGRDIDSYLRGEPFGSLGGSVGAVGRNTAIPFEVAVEDISSLETTAR